MKRFPLILGIICLILFSCDKSPQEEFVPLESVAIAPAEAALTVGGSLQLEAQITPSNATYQKTSWTTSKHTVAKVSETGLVTAVSAGRATITVSAGGKKASCAISVSEQIVIVEVTSVTIDRENLDLSKGESVQLTAVVKPDNARDKEVSWTSSNAGVASVAQDGTVTAVGAGSATITAEASGKTDDCVVTVTVPVQGISLDREKATIFEGDELFLTATVLPDDASDPSVSWNSSDTDVATVIEGTVKAAGIGTAVITAKAGDQAATCVVTVSKKTVHVTSIALDKTNLSLTVGDAATLVATVLPQDAADRSVIWESTNHSIATVDAEGNVSAISAGAVTITATTADGGLLAGCEVTVTASDVPGPPDPPEPQVIHVTSIALDKTSCELEAGASMILNADVLPEDADDKSCSWSSSNSGIAAVDADGKVTAIASGTATITATTTDGQLTASCTVTVFVPEIPVVHVSSIALDRTALNLAVGEYATLKATVLPENAEDRSFNWKSSNQSIARIDADGRVSALSAGTVTITATTTDGGLTAACEVTVYTPYIDVTSVTLNKYSLNFIEGESETLTATVMPVNATDKSIVWSSSNTMVATVDNGLVTAVKEGSATITAAAGGKTANCTVTVSAPEVPPVIPPDPEDHPYTSNVTWTLGSRAYDHTTGGEYDPQSAVVNGVQVEKIVKLGTSGSNGDFTVNIPAGTTYIGFFALGWKGSTPQLTLTCNGTSRTYDIKANAGVASTPPYTISTTEEDAYFTFDITGSTPTTVKFQSAGRVVVWGINAYNGENPNPGGGETPGGDTPGGDTPGGDTPGGGGDPVFAGWMELPATDDSNLYFVAHKSTANASGRNYSYYWDADALVARWVVYPLNPDIIGTGTRTDKWAEDNALPNGVAQPILKKAFNPSSYSRGHQIASADRLRYADNVQTFYYTNMTPQESKFNGGVWNSLEQKVRSWSGKFDTLYVVTGCVVEGSTKYAFDNSGKRVKVPVGYYKALLGYDKSQKKGITSQTGGYTGIAFYFDHFGSYTSSAYMNQSMTIDALEQKVGVDFFVNLPAAVGEEKANKAESTRDTWWNNN
ncbi:MAG: Ig-like domain-containing protein [Bacteroidales bacterium]|nr:Ig-like domain-containing protein [Bacteroidales bacterium]